MSSTWRHVQAASSVIPQNFNIPTPYPGEDDLDSIACAYCGESMYDYDARDYWELPYDVYKNSHAAQARWMKRVGIAPENSHLRLSGSVSDHHSTLHICPLCGWWLAVDRAFLWAVKWQVWYVTLVSAAVLNELKPNDITAPIKEVRRYLMRRFDARYSLHPRIFEETVASVFKDYGYRTELTGYSRDGGVDIVLRDKNDERIAVQVKRRRRSIEVEQIRSFLGALTLGGFTRGVFVSSSNFQRGAQAAARQCTKRHIPIELIDPGRFFDMLGIAQLNESPDPDDCGISKEAPPHFS